MRLHLMALAALFIIVMSCKPDQARPEYTLTDEQLSNLLNDMYFSEALLMSQTGEKRDSLRAAFWQRMTEVYKTDEVTLRKELESLKSDPEKLKKVFDHVKAEVDSLQ